MKACGVYIIGKGSIEHVVNKTVGDKKEKESEGQHALVPHLSK